MEIDIAALSDEQLEQLRTLVLDEQGRRMTVATAQQQVEGINRAVLQSEGIKDGDPWRQPTGAHDAYPEGAVVLDGGKTWVSLVGGNVWQPGVSGWREQAQPAPAGTPAMPPQFHQPTGAHDAYGKGDRVTFEGGTWESLIDGNIWTPTGYPQGWKNLS